MQNIFYSWFDISLMVSISDIICGYFTPQTLWIWILIQFGLGIIFIFSAYRFYIKSNPYSIMNQTISFLGSWIPERNPKGWWNLSIALFILGGGCIPLNLYYFRQMMLISVWAAWIGLILCMIGAIGIILVGIFPDNEGYNFFKDVKYGQIHNLVAILAFGGFGLGNMWYGFLVIFDSFSNNPILDSWRFIPSYIILYMLIGVIIFIQLRWDKICKQDKTKKNFPGDGIYSFPLWEWILTTYLFIMMYYAMLSF